MVYSGGGQHTHIPHVKDEPSTDNKSKSVCKKLPRVGFEKLVK